MATDTTTAPARMNAEEFHDWTKLPTNAGRRYELDSGEVIEMPPPTRGHGFYCWLAIKLLTEYLTRRGVGHILTNDTGIVVARDPDTLRGADLMVFLRPPQPADFERPYVEDVPDLVVEIVSPSDTAKMLNRRVEQYLRRGIPLVWVIYPQTHLVYVYRPNEFNIVLDETDELTGNGVLPEFSCRVSDLFTLPGGQLPNASN